MIDFTTVGKSHILIALSHTNSKFKTKKDYFCLKLLPSVPTDSSRLLAIIAQR